jgi:hypothetical protein
VFRHGLLVRYLVRLLGSFLLVSVVLAGGCVGETPEAGSSSDGAPVPPETSAVLRSLPYADSVPLAAGERREGVTRWVSRKTSPGLTLFTPRREARALLVDLAGRTRHVWAADLADAGPWQHVELLPGGDLLVLVKDELLARIDWDSNPVWTIRGRFHHDVVRGADGDRLWALDRHERVVSYPGGEVPVLTDRVLEIDAETGEVLRTVELLPALRGFIEARLPEIADWFAQQGGRDESTRLIPDTQPDLFHTNSVVELAGDVPGLGRAGDLLLSVRHLDRLVVLDPGTGELGWVWGKEAGLDGQHHATVLPDGHVLLFDNGRERGWSRVLEVDPAGPEVVWSYQAEPRESFWSRSRGSAQRLADGDTLVTESDLGRIFEVTPDGRIVWEYLSQIYEPAEPDEPPARPDGEPGPVRAAIYRATRIEGALLDSLREPLRRSRRAAGTP